MLSVVNCVASRHNTWLVLLSVVVCVAGALVTIRLFRRSLGASGRQRYGWNFLTAVSAGSSIWSTHFIAMLGYEPGVPVSFDPVITMLSLLIAMGGAGIGFLVATSRFSRFALAFGGAVVGLSIAAMHYTGMLGYRVDGLIEWNETYVIASIVLGTLFAGAALQATGLAPMGIGRALPAALLTTAIVTMHFTGMTAFHVTPMTGGYGPYNVAAVEAMALSIAVVGLIIIGTGISSYLIDSSTRFESDEQLRRMALHDPLTGLPNRLAYHDRLDAELKRTSDEEGRRVAVIGIDLDRFKEINDAWGHSVGDTVLCLLAERLAAIAGDDAYAARLGGDEFAAIKAYRHDEELHAFLEDIDCAMREPIARDGLETSVGASIGVAAFPGDGETKETLVKNADLAMYRAKSDETDTICFYDSGMGEVVRARRALVADLRRAIDNDELDVHYQVQTSVADGSVCGYEALLRWRHPVHGPISPAEFIPLAEASGLIVRLGEWVLHRACRDAAQWPTACKVAVNVSAVQLAHGNLVPSVQQALVGTGLQPQRLELELTETALIDSKIHSLHIIRQIKALGVRVALDDFGTGYSSLDTLRSFPFDRIKLDRSFLNGLERSPQSVAIIRAVLALGKSLNVPVLAEGVETEEQLAFLRTENCDEAQGFLLGRPRPGPQHAAVAAEDQAPARRLAVAAGRLSA